MRHKWTLNNSSLSRTRDMGIAQCEVCGIFRQYIKGVAEYWRGDDHLPKRPNCKIKLQP